MKVKIEKLKPPYPPCEECWTDRKAKFRVVVRFGQGNKYKKTLRLCKLHLNQKMLIAKKFLKAFEGVVGESNF